MNDLRGILALLFCIVPIVFIIACIISITLAERKVIRMREKIERLQKEKIEN